VTNDGETNGSPGLWTDLWRLSQHFGSHRWLAIPLVVVGIAAAIAETVGIGLAVIFLFALLDQGERLGATDGLLGRIYSTVEETVGADTGLIAASFFLLVLFNAALVYANAVVSGVILNRVAERMRNLVHDVYTHVGYRYLQKREQGELLHTLATESWTVSEAFYSLAQIAVNVCAVLVFGVGVFVLSWKIGIIALAGIAVAALLPLVLAGRVRRLSRQTLAANQILAERMLATLSGMRTLRLFAREPYMMRVFEAASSKVRVLAIRSEAVKSLIGPMSQTAGLGVLVVIVLAARGLGEDVVVIIATVLLLLRIQPYLFGIEAERLSLIGMSASLRDVRRTLERTDKPWPRAGTREFKSLQDGICFESVGFSHDPGQRITLTEATFSIPAGATIAIVGASGSGKSTILNLILRLYEPDEGRITVDGSDLAEFTRESWLSRIAIAGQDVEMVEGTVLQNVHVGNPDATLEEVRQACETAEILTDLEALPDGLRTRVGMAGLSLSGGQRQRLGLARALLRRPEILLLDEAMSALEPDREDRIIARILELMHGRTLVVVSHRASPVLRPDVTILVEDGSVRPCPTDRTKRPPDRIARR
jgi:ATP-binding cassette, subfamily B, bacterial MsbA